MAVHAYALRTASPEACRMGRCSCMAVMHADGDLTPRADDDGAADEVVEGRHVSQMSVHRAAHHGAVNVKRFGSVV